MAIINKLMFQQREQCSSAEDYHAGQREGALLQQEENCKRIQVWRAVCVIITIMMIIIPNNLLIHKNNNFNYLRTVTHSAVLADKGQSMYKKTGLTKKRYIYKLRYKCSLLVETQRKVKQQNRTEIKNKKKQKFHQRLLALDDSMDE